MWLDVQFYKIYPRIVFTEIIPNEQEQVKAFFCYNLLRM
jgi:hypothetical protein